MTDPYPQEFFPLPRPGVPLWVSRCPKCGSHVLDEPTHEAWHKANDKTNGED